MAVGKSIRFLHLQKTGGSTLSMILRRQYALRPTFYLGRPQDEARLHMHDASKDLPPALFLGHREFTVGLKAVDHAQKITLLREPISRVRSLCQHVYEGRECYMLKDFPPGKFDLDRFLHSGNPELCNFQTRSLLPQAAFSFETFVAQHSAEAVVELALTTLLTQVTAFGLTEYFDESLMVFATTLSWRWAPVYVRRNQSDRTNTLGYEQRHLDHMAEMNHLDTLLYQRAQQHFLDHVKTQLDLATLRRFQAVNSAYQRLVQTLPPTDKLPYPLNLAAKALR
jgi:hypothetical protein